MHCLIQEKNLGCGSRDSTLTNTVRGNLVPKLSLLCAYTGNSFETEGRAWSKRAKGVSKIFTTSKEVAASPLPEKARLKGKRPSLYPRQHPLLERWLLPFPWQVFIHVCTCLLLWLLTQPIYVAFTVCKGWSRNPLGTDREVTVQQITLSPRS